jgi:predicted  nucleic acid-binding Zn-ribbon protein
MEYLTKQNETLKNEKNNLNTNLIKDAEHKINEQINIIKNLKFEINDLNEALIKKNITLDHLKKENSEFKSTIEQIENELKFSQQSVKELETKLQQYVDFSTVSSSLYNNNNHHHRNINNINNNSQNTDGFKVQENELQRLTKIINNLSKELKIKETDLNSTISLLKRKEGESLGILSTLNGLNEDLKFLKNENDLLNKKNTVDMKHLKEVGRELEQIKKQLEVEVTEKENLKIDLNVAINKNLKVLTTSNGAINNTIDTVNRFFFCFNFIYTFLYLF